MKIAHLTSVHPRYDTRIFLKECKSLSEQFEVSLVVADNLGDEETQGIHIYDVGKLLGRKNRIFKTTKRVLNKALELNADVYHLHDPELLLIAKKLLKAGKKVIFDAHEDLPKQILSKPYLKSYQRKLISWLVKRYESNVCCKLTGVIAATPTIRDKFKAINFNTIDVNNYPILSELYSGEVDWSEKKAQVCYVGGLSEVRCLSETMDSAQISRINTVVYAGKFDNSLFEKRIKQKQSNKTIFVGFLKRPEIKELYRESIAGLVTLKPIINYIDALPVKMFEYMSAGIPVIASNFPLWREIIEGHDCGICVDPLSPKAIAEAIDYLLSHPEKAAEMGKNGRKAIEQKYNWQQESVKLINFYKELS